MAGGVRGAYGKFDLDYRPPGRSVLRIEGAFGSSRFSGGVLRTPIPGQEFVNAPGRVIGQASEHVGEPGLRVEIVELGGGDQRVDRSSAPAAFVGAGEGPVLSPQGNLAVILPISGRMS